MIKSLTLKRFTAFDKITVDFSPGINVLVGENGTGKTHLMKAAYVLSTPSDDNPTAALTSKLLSVFNTADGRLGELRRQGTKGGAELHLDIRDYTNDTLVAASFAAQSKALRLTKESILSKRTPAFIPTKEVFSILGVFVENNAVDFQLVKKAFDATYSDICGALRPGHDPATDTLEEKAKWALESIEEICGGRFTFEAGRVSFRRSKRRGTPSDNGMSVNLTAEGFRKLGMLYRLIEIESITPGVSGPLFWDEPEANLNPRLLKLLVSILLELSRKGQQVVLATHNYVLLKELDLQGRESDQIRFHSLYLDHKTGKVGSESTGDYLQIHPNAIADTFADLMDRDIQSSMGGLGK